MASARPATAGDLPTVAAVLADAFADDPVMAWAFPDGTARPRLLQGMFGYLAEHLYLPAGGSTVAAEAAALWMPPGMSAPEDFWAEHGAGFAAAVEGQVERLGTLAEQMRAHHPDDPHWYLLALGVRPAAQGRGLGSQLLAVTLAAADEERMPAYLEATSARSRALYERHGFEAQAQFGVTGSPPLWAMWRPPR